MRLSRALVRVKLPAQGVLFVDPNRLAGWIGRVIPRAVVPPEASARDLAWLLATADIEPPPITSHRPVVGPVIVAAKRTLLRLLRPLLAKQADYNQASARLLQRLVQDLEAIRKSHDGAVEALGARVDALDRRLEEALRSVRPPEPGRRAPAEPDPAPGDRS